MTIGNAFVTSFAVVLLDCGLSFFWAIFLLIVAPEHLGVAMIASALIIVGVLFAYAHRRYASSSRIGSVLLTTFGAMLWTLQFGLADPFLIAVMCVAGSCLWLRGVLGLWPDASEVEILDRTYLDGRPRSFTEEL